MAATSCVAVVLAEPATDSAELEEAGPGVNRAFTSVDSAENSKYNRGANIRHSVH